MKIVSIGMETMLFPKVSISYHISCLVSFIDIVAIHIFTIYILQLKTVGKSMLVAAVPPSRVFPGKMLSTTRKGL